MVQEQEEKSDQLQLTIKPTAMVTALGETPVRRWDGVTRQGVPCHVFVAAVAAAHIGPFQVGSKLPDEFAALSGIKGSKELDQALPRGIVMSCEASLDIERLMSNVAELIFAADNAGKLLFSLLENQSDVINLDVDTIKSVLGPLAAAIKKMTPPQ